MGVDGIKWNFAESGGIFYWIFIGGSAIIQALLGQNLSANAAGVARLLKVLNRAG